MPRPVYPPQPPLPWDVLISAKLKSLWFGFKEKVVTGNSALPKTRNEDGIHQCELNTAELLPAYTQTHARAHPHTPAHTHTHPHTPTHTHSHTHTHTHTQLSLYYSDTRGRKYFFNQSRTAHMTDSILCFYDTDNQGGWNREVGGISEHVSHVCVCVCV